MNPNETSANKTYNITTNGNTVITGHKLVLIRIVVNKKGASSNTATIYNSTQAQGADPSKKIGTIDTTDRVGSIEYGIPMLNGIFIVTATGTAPDLSVVYKETP
jgi:hypothetical protein